MNLALDYQSLPEPELRQVLEQLSDSYHNSVSQVPDATYDRLVEIYESRFGEYTPVGAPVRGEKVALPYYLSSLRQVKTQEELDKWREAFPGQCVVQDKVDGLTLLFVSKNGKRQLFTRGRGVEGMDVSHMIDCLRIPHFGFDIAVRGEVVMFKETFEQYKETYSNPRNMVSGITNRKESFDSVVASQLHFLAFRLMDSQERPEVQLLQLRAVGFETPWAGMAVGFSIEELKSVLAARKAEAPYEMDGLVIYQNQPIEYPDGENPKQVVKFKISETTTTVVKEVIWGASKDRLLKPVVVYEPVNLAGAILQRTSGDNARFIIDNGIGPGAKIEITRSGDTIPRIVQVLEKVTPQFPDPSVHGEYEFSGVELILKGDNNQVRAARMEHFIKKMKVDGMGPGRVKNLVEAGIDSVKALLSASIEQLKEVDGIGSELASKIFFELRAKTQEVQLPALMAASCIFPNFGERRFEKIVDVLPNILEIATETHLAEHIQLIGGFNQLAYEFVEKLPIFIEWLKEHKTITVAAPKRPVSTTLAGMTVVFSGFRDSNLQDQIKERGGKVTTSISGKTTLLILKNLNDGKGKAEEAAKRGIPTISLEQFVSQYIN